jgi:hypothetical protein
MSFDVDEANMWLDAMDQFMRSRDYEGPLRAFVDENCFSFFDVKSGEHGLYHTETHHVRALVFSR